MCLNWWLIFLCTRFWKFKCARVWALSNFISGWVSWNCIRLWSHETNEIRQLFASA